MSSPAQTTKNDSAVEAAGTAAAAVATVAATAAATSKANANGIHVQRVGQQMFPKLMNATLFVLLLLCCRVQLYVAAAGTELTGNHATRSATKEFQEFCTSKAAQLYEFYIDTFHMSQKWEVELMLLFFLSMCLLYVCARFHKSYSLVLCLKWIALQFIIATVWSSVVKQTPLPVLNLFVFVCLLIWIFTAVNELPNESIEQSDRMKHGWYSKVSIYSYLLLSLVCSCTTNFLFQLLYMYRSLKR